MSLLRSSLEMAVSTPEAARVTLGSAATIALGGIASWAIRGREKANYEATHDGLTGLLNAQGFEAVLEKNGPPQAVIYIDATNLKGANDKLGHSAGDRGIVGVANTIKTILRKDDFAARIGGDEFVVLLNKARRNENKDIKEPPTSQELLETVTDRMEAGITGFLSENPDLYEAGFNVAVGGVVSQEGMTTKDMKEMAEQKMYQAKEQQHAAIGAYR